MFTKICTMSARNYPASKTHEAHGSNNGYPCGTKMGFATGFQMGPKRQTYEYMGHMWEAYESNIGNVITHTGPIWFPNLYCKGIIWEPCGFVWGFTPYEQYFSYLMATVHKSMFPGLFLTSTYQSIILTRRPRRSAIPIIP